AGVAFTVARDLPSASDINALYTEYLAAHFDEFMSGDELPLREGVPAVLLGLLSGGRLDKRIHPNTGVLLAGVVALRALHRDGARARTRLEELKARFGSVWSRGELLVTPTCTLLPPRHGRSAFAYRLMSFCKLGNLTDATALALPFGRF